MIHHFQFHLNEHRIYPSNSVNYLGITIDEVLSWNKQVDNICKKLSRANGIISKLRHFAPLDVLTSVYYSIFYSYFLYGLLVWNFTSADNINKIQKLQKKCVRIITFADFHSHSNPIFEKLELLKITDLIICEKLKFCYKFKSSLLPNVLLNLFQENHQYHLYDTRNKYAYHIPRVNTTRFGIKSLKYDVPSIWNNYMNYLDILNCDSLNKFKRLLKSHFIESYKAQN